MLDIRMTRAEARALAIAAVEKKRTFWRKASRNVVAPARASLDGPIAEAEIAAEAFHVVSFHDAGPGVAGWRELPLGPRVWRVVSSCDGDLCNGGFWQYFGNATGDLTELAIEAFRTIGSPARAELFERAKRLLFPSGVVPDQQTRLTILDGLAQHADVDSIDAELGTIEDAYYALARSEPIDALLLAFASTRVEDFFVDP